MLKLSPLRSEKVWGYEDWIASVHPDLPQPDFIQIAKDYPLLVKIIQANDTLSIQVHPDDRTAENFEGKGACGKTECWYILDAEPGAKLVYGLNKNYSKDEISQAIKNSTLEQLLNQVEVHKGDFVYISAGTVHAIGGGIKLMEVQQSCNITYRLYDWGRPRELHIEKGVESIKDNSLQKIAPLPDNFECPYFSLVKKVVKGGYSFFCRNLELIFIAAGKNLSGTFTLADGTRKENMYLYEEEIFVLLPGEKITIEGNGEVIRIKSK